MTTVDSLQNSIKFVVLTKSADICYLLIISVSSIFIIIIIIDDEHEREMLVVTAIFIPTTTNLIKSLATMWKTTITVIINKNYDSNYY